MNSTAQLQEVKRYARILCFLSSLALLTLLFVPVFHQESILGSASNYGYEYNLFSSSQELATDSIGSGWTIAFNILFLLVVSFSLVGFFNSVWTSHVLLDCGESVVINFASSIAIYVFTRWFIHFKLYTNPLAPITTYTFIPVILTTIPFVIFLVMRSKYASFFLAEKAQKKAKVPDLNLPNLK